MDKIPIPTAETISQVGGAIAVSVALVKIFKAWVTSAVNEKMEKHHKKIDEKLESNRKEIVAKIDLNHTAINSKVDRLLTILLSKR